MGAKVVFVGGGHTHVLALQRLAKTWPAGIKPVLVTAPLANSLFGMLPGYVAGFIAAMNVLSICAAWLKNLRNIN